MGAKQRARQYGYDHDESVLDTVGSVETITSNLSNEAVKSIAPDTHERRNGLAEFPTTSRLEVPIAMAARRGLRAPVRARGIAMAL